MRKYLRYLSFVLICLALTSTSWAFSTGNHLANKLYATSRVDSWPGQPNYPQQPPPTNPIPPTWPGNPTPGNPGNGNYESAEYLFSTGRQAFAQGNFYNSVQYLRKFLDRYPYEYRVGEACYLVGESYRRLNDFYNAITFFRKVSSQYSNYTEADKATYYIGYCMVKISDYQGAVNEFRNFISRFPTSTLVDDAWYVMGRTYELLNDRYNAILAYQQVVYNYSHSNYYSQALERLNYLNSNGNGDSYPIPPQYPPSNPIPPSYPGNDTALSDYELYNRGHSEFIAGNTTNAVTYFDELIKRYPTSSYADDAYFWKGRARWQQKNFLDAITQFETILSLFPSSELVPNAVYTLAECEFAYGRVNASNRPYLNRAASHFAWYQQTYPSDNYAPEALVRAGECYEQLGDYSSAKFYFQKTVDLYPNSAAAMKAREKLNGTW